MSEPDELLAALSAPSWGERVEAVERAAARLATLRRGDERRALLEALARAAEDPKWEVRKAVALAFGEPDVASKERARRALKVLAEDESPWVRSAAAQALRWRAGGAGVPRRDDVDDPTFRFVAEQVAKLQRRALDPRTLLRLAQVVGEHYYANLGADTAHELRTLLTPALGYAEELRDYLRTSGKADATSERLLAGIVERTDLVERLIDDLRTYTATGGEDAARVELGELVRRAVSLAQERARRDTGCAAEVALELAAGVVCEAVPSRLTRAITNVVVNALQAQGPSGLVAVTLSPTEAGAALVVEDTGPGMSEEEVELALKRFKSTRRDRGGTGLGLPIARKIVEQEHGGRLLITSRPGEGTRVRVEFPRERPEERW